MIRNYRQDLVQVYEEADWANVILEKQSFIQNPEDQTELLDQALLWILWVPDILLAKFRNDVG